MATATKVNQAVLIGASSHVLRFVCFAAIVCGAVLPRACAERPNIVMVLTDDQAPWAFGEAVRAGQFDGVPVPSTPNMDRLAKEGAVFRNFFCTTPVCSPARAALMTGRYASQLGIPDFIPQPGHNLFVPGEDVFLNGDETVTIAEMLQHRGYRTGLLGKWHLGDWTDSNDASRHPTSHGFDYFMGLTGGGTSPKDPELEKDGKVQRMDGLTIDLLTREAIAFVKRNSDRPFFLCLSTRAPHGPWLPVAPEDLEPYQSTDVAIPSYPGLDEKSIRKKMKEYLASTTGVDRNLGKLLATIDELRLRENTVIVFTSDHGFNMGHNGIWHKGNGIWATKQKPPGNTHHGTRVISDKYRPNLYDLSLRVPTIIRWPGVIEPETVITDTATHLDWFPTFADIAGGSNVLSSLPGRSLTSVMRGQTPSGWEQGFYSEYKMVHYAQATLRGYRTPQYKLIRDTLNAGRDEFYDLRSDPGESNNLIASQDPAIRKAIEELDAKLDAGPN
ncbi:sulfatase-like hydrolase/transferase [Rhodopirellula sp. JC740]|uniref:Sulfatase-like hydrolase/transferase n=1 Tax=Rhodopirellula halodulae TaxID=2894198 RepID=A0ABS8NC55_9BACT|nr:sulfatase-like hydrolase/transferase [Rhodopirellula sp. JC740]MCC9640989.1 sulfatase-like hydrolase/transferase [Rhodopirellula sp. JC740]